MDSNFIHAEPDEKKAVRALRKIEKEKAYEFIELVQRVYETEPEAEDMEKLQNWLDDYPEIWTLVFDLANTLEKNLIRCIIPYEAGQLAIQKNINELRQDLGYEKASRLESTLIDSIVLSWLRYQWAEFRVLALKIPMDEPSSVIAFWEKRLSISQSRYLKACETLAKVRKLSRINPLLQANMVAQNGQEVYVDNDLSKK
jgi:hypothetical protein